MTKLRNTKRGFTLVELMVVVVLLAISVGVTGDVLASLMRSYNKTQVLTEIEQQANFAKLKLEKEVRSSTGIANIDSTSLLLDMGTDDIEYYIDSQILYRKVGSDSAQTLTYEVIPGGVLVSCDGCPGSECFSGKTTVPAHVNVCLVFDSSSTGSSFSGSTTLQSTIVLRGN
jgi:prepilin-type N-terminal cleavage/methylation domain-containing protein